MKIAMVVDWPSLDAPEGKLFSEWEWQVTKELMQAAGLQPGLILPAYPHPLAKWEGAWQGQRIGGTLNEGAYEARRNLWERLEGYDMALTMGSHAMYCLTDETKIDTYRGTHVDSPHVEGLQVVPTYAPVVYSRMAWAERPVVVSAMRKARERYVDRTRAIYLPETLDDFAAFEAEHIKDVMSFDVETNMACRVTEFSVAPTPDCCLYVQLEDRAHNSVWSAEDELGIWMWLWRLSKRKDLTWVMQNATYDLSYLVEQGIKPQGKVADTMLRHHAWQPEWEKSLGFLAALHLPTRAWKHLRSRAKKDFNKAGAL